MAPDIYDDEIVEEVLREEQEEGTFSSTSIGHNKRELADLIKNHNTMTKTENEALAAMAKNFEDDTESFTNSMLKEPLLQKSENLFDKL